MDIFGKIVLGVLIIFIVGCESDNLYEISDLDNQTDVVIDRSNIHNVRNYGAEGDGITDDTDAISAAIEAAESEDIILFPEGSYLVSRAVLVTKTVKFMGEDSLSNILISRGFHGFIVQADNVHFKNINFIGNCFIPNDGFYVIYADLENPSRRGSVRSCSFIGFSDVIKLNQGCHEWEIKHCNFNHFIASTPNEGYGVLIGDATGCTVDSNYFYGGEAGGRHAVYLSAGASYNSVRHNYIENFNSASIQIYSKSTQPRCGYNKIEYNEIHDELGSYPVVGSIQIVGNTYYNQIRHNIIVNPKYIGINVMGFDDAHAIGNTIYYNTIVNAGTYGILTHSKTSDTSGEKHILTFKTNIRYNEIANCGNHGIQSTNTSETTIIDNKIGLECPTNYVSAIRIPHIEPYGKQTILINEVRKGTHNNNGGLNIENPNFETDARFVLQGNIEIEACQ